MGPVDTKRRSQGDKYEFSPSNRAKCQKCRKKIHRGTVRVGVEEYSARYNKHIHRYYHDTCFPAKNRLRLAGGTPQDELARQSKEQVQKHRLLTERGDLRESLRHLRRLFANRLDLPPFMIWADTVLDDLVVKMPKNQEELLKVHGIGPKKYRSFGDPILQVIRHYHRAYVHRRATSSSVKPPPRSNTAAVATNNKAVVAVETLSCDDIVSRKFEHAAANGYVISVD